MGGSSAELRLPTQAVAVELARAGRASELVELFVAGTPRRGRNALAAEVAALLESEPGFLPVREPDAAGGLRIALIGKQAILWVAVSLRETGGGPVGDAVPEEVDGFEPSEILMLFDHRHEIRVELDVGTVLEGHVLYSSPADRPRLIDHLNQSGRFLRVWTSEALHLVNKHHIVRAFDVV